MRTSVGQGLLDFPPEFGLVPLDGVAFGGDVASAERSNRMHLIL